MTESTAVFLDQWVSKRQETSQEKKALGPPSFIPFLFVAAFN